MSNSPDLCYRVSVTWMNRDIASEKPVTRKRSELFTMKFYAFDDGLLGYCKAKIRMGNLRLDLML